MTSTQRKLQMNTRDNRVDLFTIAFSVPATGNELMLINFISLFYFHLKGAHQCRKLFAINFSYFTQRENAARVDLVERSRTPINSPSRASVYFHEIAS